MYAISSTRIKGKFLRREAEVLENMHLAFFDDLVAPVEEKPKLPEGVKMGLWEGDGDEDDGNDGEE